MTSQIVGSDYTDGALLPNYVNGRLLVAEDLATGQQSLRTRDTRIGEAAGVGVVRGLWVTGTSTTLTVQAGLGISRAGEPVVVPKATTLQLTSTTAPTGGNPADFACCGGGADGVESALTSGVLLLTARPACRLEGQAPLVPPPGSTVSSCCAAQWLVQGVEFRAIRLPVGTAVAGQTVSAGNRRSLVAHWCFGTEQLARLGQNPFTFDGAYSGLDQLDAGDLTTYDVPLAVFSWDGAQVADLDNWSARRRVTDPDPTPSSWSVTVSDRRTAEGQARFLQFQDQAEELVSRALAGSAAAADFFGFLPPVGFLPVDNTQFKKSAEASVPDIAALTREPAPPTPDEAEAEVAAEWRARAFNLAQPAERASLAQPRATSKAYLQFYKKLITIADATVGYGYDPERFFGGLARFGGLLDWEVAEWALNQSWKAMPVSTKVGDTEEGDTEDADAEAGRLRRPPYTYYYVIQNLEAADASTSMFVTGGRMLRKKLGFVRSDLYVVFIANRRWASGADAPAVPYSLRTLTYER